MKIHNFEEALNYLYKFIPQGVKQKFPGDIGLNRTKYFLELLGDPQNKIKVIHVAGTSGKGSTAYLISLVLKSLGFKVGFHVSPFIVDIRERFQINNQFISKAEFSSYLNELVPFIAETNKSRFGQLTYFEIVTALAFYIFWKKQVNYAVIETGMGGWYDATNCVTNKNKIAVITKIGLDHTNILGKTLAKIARQKIMITGEKNIVISIWQHLNVRKVMDEVTKEKNAKLFFIKKNINFDNVIVSSHDTLFNFQFLDYKFKKIKLSLIASYQAENCSLALGTVALLSQRDNFLFDEGKIKQTLKRAYFAARFEIINVKNKKIIIDGAHNPQKMLAFTSNLRKLFPNQKFHFLVAFKAGKNYSTMLNYIIPLASKITLTSFFYDREDLVHLSEKPEQVASIIKKTGFIDYQIISNPKKALENIVGTEFETLIITGSLYLIGSIYPNLK